MKIEEKLENLAVYFKGKKVIIAFSGGVDSSLLLLTSLKYSKATRAIYIKTPLSPDYEYEGALKLISAVQRLMRMDFEVISIDSLSDKDVRSNTPERCYFCKRKLMNKLIQRKDELKYDIIVEGTNLSEITGHRPGLKAIKELRIKSPFLELKWRKEDIRRGLLYISENLKWLNINIDDKNLTEQKEDRNKEIKKGGDSREDILVLELQNIIKKVAIKPSNPCLATRVQYFVELKPEILKKINDAEIFIRNNFKIDVVRVRYFQGEKAVIEVPLDQLTIINSDENFKKIKERLSEIGFKKVEIDPHGYRSGSLLEGLRSG
ncbi:MAG: hypothetical protein ACTSU2_08115 [Promethearchaeota archaeon]